MKLVKCFLSISVLTTFLTAFAGTNLKPTKIVHFKVAESPVVKEGSCWTNSLVTPRKGAWRCMIKNSIYDPCFSTPSWHKVICGVNPAEGKPGFAVKLMKSLPKLSNLQKGNSRPFQMRLSDGSICAPFTGTLIPVGKEVIEYGCQSNVCATPESCQMGVLSIKRNQPQWMAQVVVYAISKEGTLDVKSFKQIPIEAVWK